MKKKYIGADGGKEHAPAFAQTVLRDHGISLSMGIGLAVPVRCNGHKYRQAHIDSCCQLRNAWAIRLCKGQKISWFSRSLPMIPAYFRPVSEVVPVAPKGAVLVFEYAMGNGAAYPQPGGYFQLSIDGRQAVDFSLKKNSHLYEGSDGIRLYLEVRRKKTAVFGQSFSLDEFIQNESTYVNGIAYLYIPPEQIKGRKGFRLSIKAHNPDGESTKWFRLGYCYQQMDCDLSDGLRTVTAPWERKTLNGKNIWFGDIHIHTGQTESLKGKGCGRGSVKENLHYARDISGLDFCAITDHDWQMDEKDWRKLREENDRFTESGKFVALHAYEWTSGNYGHRNVYFRDGKLPDTLKPFDYQRTPEPKTKFGRRSGNDPTPEELWAWLDGTGLTAMTIPHHPNAEQFPMDFFRFWNEKYDRCVEVYSNWGCMLESGRELNLCCDRIGELGYLRYAGKLPFGFVASSDGHDGNAGEANVTRSMRQMAHYAGSGRLAVFAEELTRESVFDAIYHRRCYATTGAHILMDVQVNGKSMGEVITEPAEKLNIEIDVLGTVVLTFVEIYHSGKLAWKSECLHSDDFSECISLPARIGDYYVQVRQVDGEYAWSSPVFCR